MKAVNDRVGARGHDGDLTLFDVEALVTRAARPAVETDSSIVSTIRDKSSTAQFDTLVRELHRTADPLERAGVAAELRDLAEATIAEAVHEANDAGVSWRAIGAHLGIPFQTLYRRYGGEEGS